MNTIWILLHLAWLYAGCKMNELKLQAQSQIRINLCMAACLLVDVVLSNLVHFEDLKDLYCN